MRTSVAVSFYHASPLNAHLLEARANECNHNGNQNFLPVPNLQSQPMFALAGRGAASYKDSGVPSSLKDWLTSKAALLIG
jgi:hypothetical protein